MQQKVQKYINKKQLLTQNALIIVGVSGGADSVALLHLLIQLGYPCVVAHCNFNLRMEESERDESFVRKLASDYKLQYYSADFQTKEYAHTHHISIEMAARELRYTWFNELLVTHNAQAIAVGHHTDDSIETLLMNLTRGTGLKGLTGISPRHDMVVRPLLCCTRLEIEHYVAEHHLLYITDSSNASVDYQRNKFRNQVLPLLEEINPSVRNTLYDSIQRFDGIQVIYQQAIDRIKKEIVYSHNGCSYLAIEKIKMQVDIPTILYELLSEYGFNQSTIKEIAKSIEAESGKQFFSPTHRLVKDRHYLMMVEIENQSNVHYYIHSSDTQITYPIELHIDTYLISNDFIVSKKRNRIQVDASKLQFPLHLRHWREGDTFYPFGMTQRKKISDFFIDNKFSILEKEACWLLISGKNDVVWIVGHRMDNRFKLSVESKIVVEFSILNSYS